MTKFILLFAITLLSISCSTDKTGTTSVNLSKELKINLLSSEGNNLLNTSNYKSDNFNIYYKSGNDYVEKNDVNLDYPKHFMINTETNPISMKLFLNDLASEPNPITVIKWNTTESDTIKTTFRRGFENNSSYVICEKVWLNDVLVWEIENNPNLRQITIIK